MRIIGVDHSSKKELVMESGAEHFVGLDKEEVVVAAVQKVSDGLGVQACLVLAGEHAIQKLRTIELADELMGEKQRQRKRTSSR